MRPEPGYWDAKAAHGAEASVIDPNDRRGHKNAYIAAARNRALLGALGAPPQTVLDFGCGSGGLLAALAAAGHRAIGIDISGELLALARRRPQFDAPLIRYDGTRLPLADRSVDAACTWIVLNHVVDDNALHALLRELHRVLRPGGRLLAIEQVLRRTVYDPARHTHRRSVERWLELFGAAGFTPRAPRTLRFGHFPLLYAVRYGLVPRRWHGAIAAIERGLARAHPRPWLDYADVLFELERPGGT
jgi:SAM-dependent methyltransferase